MAPSGGGGLVLSLYGFRSMPSITADITWQGNVRDQEVEWRPGSHQKYIGGVDGAGAGVATDSPSVVWRCFAI